MINTTLNLNSTEGTKAEEKSSARIRIQSIMAHTDTKSYEMMRTIWVASMNQSHSRTDFKLMTQRKLNRVSILD